MNDGNGNDLVNRFTCDCQPGYSGLHCEGRHNIDIFSVFNKIYSYTFCVRCE